jgi:hypothetical protein
MKVIKTCSYFQPKQRDLSLLISYSILSGCCSKPFPLSSNIKYHLFLPFFRLWSVRRDGAITGCGTVITYTGRKTWNISPKYMSTISSHLDKYLGVATV